MPLVPPSLGRHPGRPEEHTRLRAHVISHVISRDPHARRSTRVSEHMWGTHDGGRMTLRYYSYTTAIPSRGSGGNGDGPTPVSVGIGGSEPALLQSGSTSSLATRSSAHWSLHRAALDVGGFERVPRSQRTARSRSARARRQPARLETVTEQNGGSVGSRACVHLRSHKDAPTHEHD